MNKQERIDLNASTRMNNESPEIRYMVPASYCGRFDNESLRTHRQFIPGYSFYVNASNLKDHLELYVILREVEDLLRDAESVVTMPNNDIVNKQRRTEGFQYGLPRKEYLNKDIKSYTDLIVMGTDAPLKTISDNLDNIVNPYLFEILRYLKIIKRLFVPVNCGDEKNLSSSFQFDVVGMKQFLEENIPKQMDAFVKKISNEYNDLIYDFRTESAQTCGKKIFRKMFGKALVRYDVVIQSASSLFQKFLTEMSDIQTENTELGETYRRILKEIGETTDHE